MVFLTTTVAPSNVNNPSKELLARSGVPTPGQTGFYREFFPGPNANIPSQLFATPRPDGIGTTVNPLSHSVVTASGFWGSFQKAMQSGAIPESLSSAKWSDNAKGFPQQTFLGASIRSFTMQGGFGDSSSSLTVDLVVDEYNPSDRTLAGKGDDVYHSGLFTIPDRTFRVGAGGGQVANKTRKTVGDNFVPPIPGSPVFFKFGPNFATVEEAYRKTFDDTYGYNTMVSAQPARGGSVALKTILEGAYNLPPNSYVDLHIPGGFPPKTEINGRTIVNYIPIRNTPLAKGKDHIVFGGILQTYNQSRATNGNPLYTVNVIDPREILSNVTIILNNYAGPTYEQKNLLNVYGFLEYNPTPAAKAFIKSQMQFENVLKKRVQTVGPDIGQIILEGDDNYYKLNPNNPIIDQLEAQILQINNQINIAKREMSAARINKNLVLAQVWYARLNSLLAILQPFNLQLNSLKNSFLPSFPMTGTGFSRRSSQGIPYYRVRDAINALMERQVLLHQDYKDQGFGGKINFRGFNYVVDFGGLPELPEYYYLDYDEINILELALEICDITNRDLFVSLLPIINHPACLTLYNYNNNPTTLPQDMIAGIIRLDTIDRSEQPVYGAIKQYIDDLANDPINPVYVENQDLGYELSNVVTDKFIVGAQEVNMHFFSSNADRDNIAFKKTKRNGVYPGKPQGYQWTLEASLEQQILPYYGKLGNNAVTIPKGFGAYQQILLDSSSLNAAGVGAYYVATEMELRCALISYDRWKEFLSLYNDTYMDSIESDDPADVLIAGLQPAPIGVQPPVINISKGYSVTVPRSVFDTYALQPYGTDGLPASPCNPPYGYPLYYKRMTKIGIPEAGLTNTYNRLRLLQTNLAELQCSNRQNSAGLIKSQYKDLQSKGNLGPFEIQYYRQLETLLAGNLTPRRIDQTIGALESIVGGIDQRIAAIGPRLAKKNSQNALKVYNFVKAVAEECLGKKYLVKIPQEVNLFYSNRILMPNTQDGEYTEGPFGFKPRSTKNIAGYEFSPQFAAEVRKEVTNRPPAINMMHSFLSSGVLPNPQNLTGALQINYNPLSEKYESNYTPVNVGGYFEFDLYQNTLGASAIRDINRVGFRFLPSGVRQGLIPQDLTNFIDENGRVSPYVRFDNSQDLGLEGLNDNDFTQQLVGREYMITDFSEALDNTGPQKFHSFPKQNNATPKPQQIAFVKCSVEEELYLPPRIDYRNIPVHGQFVKDIGTVSPPRKIFIPCSGLQNGQLVPGSGVEIDSFSFYQAHFIPLPKQGSPQRVLDFERHDPFLEVPGGATVRNSLYVNTEKNKLNTNHAYALISLPNRIIPTKDARFRDGPNQSVNAEMFKHLMTMDVVRDLPGFDKPTLPLVEPPVGSVGPSDIRPSLDNTIHAWFAMKKANSDLTYGLPQRVNANMPSPIYPDLVALPLLSNDRCYGPWVSSQLDGQAYLIKNIGGKVEFIKDENLSPWNYGGYKLMDEAGRLQAEFSNSLLLFSERGSFTVPDLPKGNSLCGALSFGGPLVTSINLDVSTGGARTTYQMDLYTASFGKLQKQKQDEISKISRQRKKLISERNALIRKGLGKNQSSRNFLTELNMLNRGILPGIDQFGLSMVNAMTNITMSTNVDRSREWVSSPSFGNTSPLANNIEHMIYQNTASIQNPLIMGQTSQAFNDQFDLAKNYANSVSVDIKDMYHPASYGPNPVMSYIPFSDVKAKKSLLYIDEDEIRLEDEETSGPGSTM